MSDTFLTRYANGQRHFHIRLTPKAAAERIGDFMPLENGEEALKVSVTAVPKKGKANAALIKLLSKTLRVPKSAITITHGETDRNKRITIDT